MDKTVSCKECRHLKLQLKNPFTWFTPYMYKCKKAPVPEKREIDPVTGKTIVEPAHYENCSFARREYGPCGLDGLLWQPKYKKDIFKYLSRM
jgi:hypothetical protein